MAISIKNVKGEKRVYKGRKHVGTLRKFCCGIDFRPKHKPQALFSILKVKYGTRELEKCVESLLSIDIPDKSFHWNFNYEIAKDDCKLLEYAVRLSEVS